MADLETLTADGLNFSETTDPSTPASGKLRVYGKTTGLFYITDSGTVVGPLAAAGAASLTSSESDASGDTALGSGTWTDTTCSLSLATGTWIVHWKILVEAGGARTVNGRLTDSGATTEYDYAEIAIHTNPYRSTVSGTAKVTLGSTTTVKTQARSDGAANTISRNGGNGTANHATHIVAVKIA